MNQRQSILYLVITLLVLVPVSWAASDQSEPVAGHASMLAQADSKAEPDEKEKPRSGTLVMPADYEKASDNKEKKCMTVCSRWGETCVFDVNRGRKCRRTCKEFAEECF